MHGEKSSKDSLRLYTLSVAYLNHPSRVTLYELHPHIFVLLKN